MRVFNVMLLLVTLPVMALSEGRFMTDAEVMPFETAWRKATVKHVVDADTCDIFIDLGFEVHIETRVRILGIDAWETKGEEKPRGDLAKKRVEFLLPVGSEIRIKSKKGGSKESFGRWLVELVYRSDGGWESLGEVLLKEGHAKPYKR